MAVNGKTLVCIAVVLLAIGCLGGETPRAPAHDNAQAFESLAAPNDIIHRSVLEGRGPSSETGDVEGATDDMSSNPTAVIVTNKGEFRFELYEKEAPITVANFIELAESGFYDGLTFHRYVPGFVIQGGDPRGDGTGGSDKKIPLEVTPELTHVEGAVGMARSQDPNSASSQFYITLAPAHNLDGSYAVFGKVTKGMDVVKSLRKGDRMISVTIER